MNSSSSLVQSLYSIKNRGSAAAHQAFIVAFVKHIHIKTQPPVKQLQIETITEHHFFVGTVCGESLVLTQAACMTRIGYTTTQYIYSSSEWIVDKCGVFLALPLASYSQLCLCVDECEQTLLSFLGERAATFSTPNTLWRWCCLFPGLVCRHMLLSL